MTKNILIIISVVLGLGIVWTLLDTDNVNQDKIADVSSSGAVTEDGNIQRVKILARGGYTPRKINAKAGVETVLDIETKGTYDCSSYITIPELNYRQILPATGFTQVLIPAKKAKDSIEILCAMGMYRSTINFDA